jgi:hypothetical protein
MKKVNTSTLQFIAEELLMLSFVLSMILLF